MFGALRRGGHYRGFVFEAMSGIDIALWDILGKVHGVPCHKLWGGPVRDYTRKVVGAISVSGPAHRLMDEKIAQQVGLALLVMLMLLAFYNDIVRLLGI